MRKTSAVTAGGRRSVRYRLLAIALLPMLVILPLLLGISIYRLAARFDATLVSKVDGDLIIAQQYMARILENTEQQLVSFSESARFRDLLVAGDTRAAILSRGSRRKPVSSSSTFFYVVDGDGRILASEQPVASPYIRWDWPVVSAALSGRSKTDIDVFESKDLAALSPELAQRARLEVLPTPERMDAGRTLETRGMLIHSASALTLPGGRRAALVGGILLNQNLAFIDTINDLVYHDASVPEGSRGTATLFLDDVRISTNVRLFEGRRALGTRVSSVVRAAVLDQGRTWLCSAFVVNDWYISAYEPIDDSYGRDLG
jgi:hypothetical protein